MPFRHEPVRNPVNGQLQGGHSQVLLREQGGFVLVAVLLLIALATVLIVTTSSVSQIERKAVSNSAKEELARQNALFALGAAMAQLQSAAGPDQRVTATADILNGGGTVVNHPYWTGVWKTGTNALDVGVSPQRTASLGALNPTAAQKSATASWLVSGSQNPEVVNPLEWMDSSTGLTNSVVLALNYGTNTAYQTVRVPLVMITNTYSIGTTRTNLGGYAYWVSDEGVKAKVTINDPTMTGLSTDPSKNQFHFLTPQANLANKGSAIFGTTDLRLDTNNLPKITTLQSLANLIPGLSGSNAAQIASDFTTYGFGVLADVRRGGLRKDLTAALESPNSFTTFASTYGYGSRMLYRTADSAGLVVSPPATGAAPTYYASVNQTGNNPPVDGVSWYSLYAYYNAYKGTMPLPGGMSATGGGIAPTTSGNPAVLPNVASENVFSVTEAVNVNVRNSLLMPNVISYRMDIALSSYRDDQGKWMLRLSYYPQVVLYNPHSTRLSLANYQFQRNVGAFNTAGSYSANPTVTCIKITAKSGATTTTVPYFLVNQAPNGRFTLATKSGDCNTLEPGETRVFALDADLGTANPQAAITFSSLKCNANISADISQYCDVLSGVSTTGNSTGNAFSTTDPSTSITVTLASPSLRMQSVDSFAVPRGLLWPASDGSRFMARGGSDRKADAGAINNVRIDQLTAPRRIIGFSIRQKGLRPPGVGARNYSNALKAVPIFMGNFAGLSPIDDNFSYPWRETYVSPMGALYANGETDVNMSPNGTYWETSFGDQSAGVASTPTRYVLRDIPNQPPISLGQFMHMSAARYNTVGDYGSFGTGSMFVGGSCASPGIPTEYNALAEIEGYTGAAPQRTIYCDDSYLANEALFDRFFLSTLPPQSLNAAGTTYPVTWTSYNSANSGGTLSDPSKPLLNSRIKPYYRGGTNPPSMADLRDPDKAAANLVLDGAFNVNSTSVPAWKSFLGGLSGNDLKIYNATSGTTSTESTSSGGTKGVVFSRFWSASGKTSPDTVWSGLRVLTDAQLNDLASKIVAEVKARGPFLSLADFLNRRLGSNSSALSRCGALQAAIDKTSPDINASVKSAGVTVNASTPDDLTTPGSLDIPNLIPGNMVDGNGVTWSTAIGVPGYLMQQDIVQAIAPAISARSDTFVIRVYGDSRNSKSGIVDSTAYAEAVVQRTPEFIDQTDEALSSLGNATSLASLSSAANKSLGRRFKIISFRWLNSNEI